MKILGFGPLALYRNKRKKLCKAKRDTYLMNEWIYGVFVDFSGSIKHKVGWDQHEV